MPQTVELKLFIPGIKPNIVILEQGLQLIITVGQIVETILVLQHLETLLIEEV